MYDAVFVYFILKVCEVGAKKAYWIKCLCHKHEDLSLSLRTHIKKLGVEAHACNFREQETDGPLGFAGQPAPSQWETVSSKVVDGTWIIPAIVFWPPYVHISAVHEHTQRSMYTYKKLWESHCKPIFLFLILNFFSLLDFLVIFQTYFSMHALLRNASWFLYPKWSWAFLACSYVACHYEDTNNSFINQLQIFPHLPPIRKLKIKEVTSVSSLKITHFIVVTAEHSFHSRSALLCVPRWVSNLEWKWFALLFIKQKQD